MDGTRLKRICNNLQIDSIEKIDQKKFNGLVANLNQLDRETVRAVIERVPDLVEKVGNYFVSMQESFKTVDGKDYLEALRSQQELLRDFYERTDEPKVRDRIADELLEHSKWLRREATINRKFKMFFSVIGMLATALFVKSIQSDMKDLASRAERSSEISGRDTYRNDGYGRDPYGNDGYRRGSNGNSGYVRNNRGSDGYGRDPYGREIPRNNNHGKNGIEINWEFNRR